MTIHTPSKGARVKTLLAPLHQGFVIAERSMITLEAINLHKCWNDHMKDHEMW